MANDVAITQPRGSRTLGKYRLIAEIGRGGMASVFLAIAQGPANVQKLIVVKERRSAPGEDHEYLTMFLDECRLAARLNHPNVVQTYEVGEDGDRFFIAMEYLEGQPLSRIRSRLAPDARFNLDMQARIFCDALAGLHYAHELADFDGTPLNVVHRDVTPQNLFVTYEGQVKLVDFGIAKANDSSSETKAGVLKGKVSYMSPEQAKGEALDRRADVFSVGVMLWEAITRKRMWKGQTEIAILSHLIQGEVPGLSVEGVDPELARICKRALEPNREHRYASAQDMHADLESFLAGRRGCTARDIGKLLGEAFSADRAEIKSIIDHHVRNLRESSTELARIQLDRSGGTPSGLAPNPFLDDSRKTSQTGLASAMPAVATPTSVEQQGRKPNPMLLIGTAATVAALTTGGLVLALRNPAPAGEAAPARSGVEAPSAAPKPAPTETGKADAAPEPPPAAGSVLLKIEGIPSGAKVYVDGKQVGTGPYVGSLPKGAAKHKIAVEADGFKTYEEELDGLGDQRLKLRLDKAPPGAPTPTKAGGPAETATGAAPAPQPQPQATPHDDLGKPGQNKRQLDNDNPYQKK